MRTKLKGAAAFAQEEIASATCGLQGVLDARTARGIRDVVGAGVLGSRLQLTALGRGVSAKRRVRRASPASGHKGGRVSAKHAVKRVDRLLGNPRLHDALPEVWRAALGHVVRKGSRPLVLVDWTGGCEGSRLWTLSAAVAAPGRAVRIYEEVVPVAKLDSPAVRDGFLERLGRVLPPDAQVVVLADAGFRIPFLTRVLERGWHYVVRVRGNVTLSVGGRARRFSRKVCARATSTPRSLGPVQLGREGFACAQAVLYKAAAKGRKATSRKGTPLLWNHSRKYARAARQGWLLVTSLPHASAQEVCALYAQRMTHEEAFRDVKNARLGLGLAQARTRSPQRFAVLCLLGALILLVLHRIGERYARTHWARSLQANTVRSRKVLSVVRLGRAVLEELLAPARYRLFEALAP